MIRSLYHPRPEHWPQHPQRIAYVAIPLGLVVVACVISSLSGRAAQRVEAAAKERIQLQIAGAKEGKQILLSNEINGADMAEFVTAQGKLVATDNYELVIWYSRGTDDYLKQISGLRGATSLLLYKTDVSENGLAFAALMPHLKKLSITPFANSSLNDTEVAHLRERFPHLSIERHRGD